MNEGREAQSARLLSVADELEKAAAHARVAAGHFKSGDVPRACAHTLATEGHMNAAGDVLKEIATVHSKSASL